MGRGGQWLTFSSSIEFRLNSLLRGDGVVGLDITSEVGERRAALSRFLSSIRTSFSLI